MKRRTFLQQAGLVGLGLSFKNDAEAIALPLPDRYSQILTQPTPRKLALLVGINQYPTTSKRISGALQGCVTDVEMQRELLIHRFGFQDSDVLTLTDAQATKEAIASAFLSHLGEAQSGDLVVFHFSGYGSQVVTLEGTYQKSLVPIDEASNNDLLEDSLLSWMRSLKTDRILTILDTSYTGTTDLRRGNLRSRSLPPTTPAEKLPPLSQGKTPGSILTASRPPQPATEAQWGGFSAGLFTYALTQNLWQTTPATTIQIILSRTAAAMGQIAGRQQQPTLEGLTNTLLAGGLDADGVVTAVEDKGKTAYLWLGGLPAFVLQHYSPNSLLTSDDTQLQVRSRSGLTARTKIITGTPIQPGQLVREKTRVFSQNIGLTIALTGLQRIERVDATSAFANIDAVTTVVTAPEAADYLFGTIPASETEGSRYALFSLSGELIPNTSGEPGEAVKAAINRLVPKLKTLLAAKLLRLTVNEGSSRLDVQASLEKVVSSEVVMQRQTLRTEGELIKSQSPTDSLPTLSINSRIQYRIQNRSSHPIYVVLLGRDSGGNAIALYSVSQMDETDVVTVFKDNAIGFAGGLRPIAPNLTLTFPQPNTTSEWLVTGQAGIAEIYLITSIAPFTKTLAALAVAKQSKGDGEQFADLLNPLDVAKAVLQDLHQASISEPMILNEASTSDTYTLDVNAWATLSFIYQVV